MQRLSSSAPAPSARPRSCSEPRGAWSLDPARQAIQRRNGDALSVGYNVRREADSVGFDEHEIGSAMDDPLRAQARARRAAAERLPGQTIMGVVDRRSDDGPLEQSLIVEDGILPGEVAALLRYALEVLSATELREGRIAPVSWAEETWRKILDLFNLDPHAGALRHSLVYLAIGHDKGGGSIVPTDAGRARVYGPTGGGLPVFDRADETTRKLTAALHGQHLPNPFLARRSSSRRTTRSSRTPRSSSRCTPSVAAGWPMTSRKAWSTTAAGSSRPTV